MVIDSFIRLEWMEQAVDPQTKARANGIPRKLICDGFGTDETLKTIKFRLEIKIVLCRLPSDRPHKTQHCDVSVHEPLKTAHASELERGYHRDLTNVNKEHFAAIYSRWSEREMTAKDIPAAWAKTGLFLLDLRGFFVVS